MRRLFSGVITALVTPFCEGKIDFAALENILALQIKAKVHGLVLAGSTGEGMLLERKEYESLISFVLGFVKGRVKVFSSCTALSTSDSIAFARLSEELGVDGLMCAPPPYLRPSQEGLIRHFEDIHDSTSLPIMLYFVPQRTGIELDDKSIGQLASMDRFIAIKDAGKDLQRILRIALTLPKTKVDFLCGNDMDFLAFTANGGSGCVSVASNLIPTLMVEIHEHLNQERYSKALDLHSCLAPLHTALNLENNPTAIKYAMSLMGLCEEDVRQPLARLSFSSRKIVEGTIENLKAILTLE